MASSPPSLPPIESLSTATADDETLKSILDTLFEPSPELHALAIPSIQAELSKQRGDFTYPTLIEHVGALLLSLASASPSSSATPSTTQPLPQTPSPNKILYAILGSHPRLGAKKVTSAQSRAEQAQLSSTSTTSANTTTTTTTTPAGSGAGEREGEGERQGETKDDKDDDDLALLNAEYEARFPGLRYVVFVNGRGREAIASDARGRIARGDAGAEEREIVGAMVDIARDRAGKLGVLG